MNATTPDTNGRAYTNGICTRTIRILSGRLGEIRSELAYLHYHIFAE